MSETNQNPEAAVTPSTNPTPFSGDFRVTGSITATTLRHEMAEVLKHVEGGKGVVAVTRHNKVVAGIVGETDYKLLQGLKDAVQKLSPKLNLTPDTLLGKLSSLESVGTFLTRDNQSEFIEKGFDQGKGLDSGIITPHQRAELVDAIAEARGSRDLVDTTATLFHVEKPSSFDTISPRANATFES